MAKFDSLIELVNSMTKAEKRSFTVNRRKTDYYFLFDVICNNPNTANADLIAIFKEKHPDSDFNQTMSYLYKIILKLLLALKEDKSHEVYLFNQINISRVLFDKALYEDALKTIDKVKQMAQKRELKVIFYLAARQELEYLHSLNFPDITETELLNKHLQISEALKIIRRTNEQFVLHELMTHRILHQENVRSKQQKESLNDLVISEMSIVSSSNTQSFEINKLHQLFQSSYLIHVGDYKSALRSYYELIKLFEDNTFFWANPPVHYLEVLSGILQVLRGIKEYKSMQFYIEKIKELKKKYTSKDFQLHLDYLIATYNMLPLIDSGSFEEAHKKLKGDEWKAITSKEHLFSHHIKIEMYLHIALIYFGLNQYQKAYNQLTKSIFLNKEFLYTPISRTIRLVKLMILYELDKLVDYEFEIRSFKRGVDKTNKAYKVENIMLYIFRKGKVMNKNMKEWQKIEPELNDIYNNNYEKQLLRIFDFTAWIESKMTGVALPLILKNRT